MTSELFLKLLSKSESSILDFKRSQYKLIGNDSESELAKFVKDVIAFCNTIRNESGYIIIGVDDSNGEKNQIGLDIFLDESLFQDKIKDKVFPRPVFKYFSFENDEKRYGIFEFPVHRYEEPIMPTVKLKGLEIGKIYFRRGSSNSECNGREVIQVNDWLRTLKNPVSLSQKKEKLVALLEKITNENQKLSSSFSECLKIAIEIDDQSLKVFCKGELQGLHVIPNIQPEDSYHRKTEVLVSQGRLEISNSGNGNINQLWKELKNDEMFVETTIAFGESIVYFENTLAELQASNGNTIGILERKMGQVFPNYHNPEMPVFIYTKYDTYKGIYVRIRQRLINELIKRTN